MGNGLYTETDFVTNNDGWSNIFTGMGRSGFDKRLHTTVSSAERLDRNTLTELYRGDGIGKRIIEIPAKDMIRQWFTINGDPDGEINNYLKEIKTPQKLLSALKWNRLYGGSCILMYIDDGRDLNEQVNIVEVRGIMGLEVFDRWEMTWQIQDLYSDTMSGMYGKPEFYTITNNSTGKVFKAHESRLIVFDGEDLPNMARNENQGWGDPVITAIYERLRGLGDSYAGVEAIIQEFIIGIMKIKNLQSMVSTKGGSKAIKDRLNLLDMSRHILNSYLIDENEDFNRVTSSGTQGMSSLIKSLELVLCGISGIPAIKLFPEQTKGLGGEAGGNLRLYYDDIKADQSLMLEPRLHKIINYVMVSKDGPLNGVPLDNWSIDFNSLWQSTEKEQAETRKIVAETDNIYNEMGLATDIILDNRFGGDEYSRETILPDSFDTGE